MALFAGFFAPYGFERQDRERFFHPPTALRLQSGRLAVESYELAPGFLQISTHEGRRAADSLFRRGEKYKLLGSFRPRCTCSAPSDYPSGLPDGDGSVWAGYFFAAFCMGRKFRLASGLMGIVISVQFGNGDGRHFGFFRRNDGHCDRCGCCELIMSIPASVSDYVVTVDVSGEFEFDAGLSVDHCDIEFAWVGRARRG